MTLSIKQQKHIDKLADLHRGNVLSQKHKNKISKSRLKGIKERTIVISDYQLKNLELGRVKTVNRKKFCQYCGDKFNYNNKKQTFCSKECFYLFMRGSNNPNWKGGFFLERRPRESIEYKEWRNQVYERDNYTCQVCNVKGGKLVAHHIKSWSKYPDLRYEKSNGLTLCEECHKKTHNYGWKLKYSEDK